MTLNEVLSHFGCDKAELARKLGIEPQAVYQWPKDGDPEYIPLLRQYDIQALTKGKLKATKQTKAA